MNSPAAAEASPVAACRPLARLMQAMHHQSVGVNSTALYLLTELSRHPTKVITVGDLARLCYGGRERYIYHQLYRLESRGYIKITRTDAGCSMLRVTPAGSALLKSLNDAAAG